MSILSMEACDLEDDKKEAGIVSQSFLEQQHQGEIQSILMAVGATEHYALNVNALEFFDTNMHTGQLLLKKPLTFIPIFEDALRKAQGNILQSSLESNPASPLMSIKQHVHIRFSNLPVCPELIRVNIPKSEDVGSFIAISGNVLS